MVQWHACVTCGEMNGSGFWVSEGVIEGRVLRSEGKRSMGLT